MFRGALPPVAPAYGYTALHWWVQWQWFKPRCCMTVHDTKDPLPQLPPPLRPVWWVLILVLFRLLTQWRFWLVALFFAQFCPLLAHLIRYHHSCQWSFKIGKKLLDNYCEFWAIHDWLSSSSNFPHLRKLFRLSLWRQVGGGGWADCGRRWYCWSIKVLIQLMWD